MTGFLAFLAVYFGSMALFTVTGHFFWFLVFFCAPLTMVLLATINLQRRDYAGRQG